MCALAACGGGSDADRAAPTVTWFVGPDRLDADLLAAACTDEAAGAFTIRVEQLPADVTDRHALLARRLLAEASSMDVLSLDTAFTTEFASAGFLTPVPPAQAQAASEGIVPAALAAATLDDRLVAVPWFLDPQVLWFRGNTAERAGLDPSKPISWDDLIAGAQRIGVTVEIEDRDDSGLAEWVNALVAGAGGSLLKGQGRSATAGLDSEAGRAAASIVELYHQAGIGPGPSADALTRFAGSSGGFLLASTSAIADPALAAVQSDMRATTYPVVGDAVVAPLAGVALAVPTHAKHPEQAFAAIACLTSPTALQQLATGSQHSASRLATFDDPGVAAGFRGRDAALASVTTGVTAPATPYWAQVIDAIDETWRRDVNQDQTPVASQAEVVAAIRGEVR
ncbi:extracellular solute-binding protein [Aeromicrobium wangtongii]|uniref:extracellular solute-binding protein n=1 Tax=Aeromicrobium wangtongii TaxID=2969247 RepID=UPI0020173227|nr:extracellular solute-binding protein [Aeromicrobium wangtongii]MCL3817914.1 extracellular solute-binding protein [Aeromicrobium wangtongii]